MKKENSNFKTEDIHLAVWLKLQGIPLLDIISLAPYRSEFIFSPVSSQLLEAFLSTSAEVPLRTCINEYRHLLRQARGKVVRK